MKILGIIVAVIVGLLAWFWLSYPSVSYGFRLVVEIDTPSGLKTGSSVLNLTMRDQVAIGPRASVTQVKGEAVFVDLGDGRNVIATLVFGPNGDEERMENLAFEAFRRAGRPMDVKTLAKSKDSALLASDLIPTLVTFADIRDPKSVRVLRPDELPRVFGAGVNLRGARIEMTSDSVTRGIEKKLPLVRQLREDAKTSHIQKLGDPFRANSGQFERG